MIASREVSPFEPGARVKAAADAVLGWLAVGMLRAIRATDRKRMADFAGARHAHGRPVAQGAPDRPRQPRRRVPGKIRRPRSKRSCAASGTISAVSRPSSPISTACDLEPDPEAEGDIIYTPETSERFQQLARDGKPALIFAAHLANWELPALVAARYRLDTTVLYRRPNIGAVSDAVHRHPRRQHGHAGCRPVSTRRSSSLRVLRSRRPRRHAGRPALRQRRRRDLLRPPLQGQPAARAARAPRRLPDPRHRASCACPTGIAFGSSSPSRSRRARDADGKIDVAGTMQAITSVVEGWVREHPEQWLWLHRRWR